MSAEAKGRGRPALPRVDCSTCGDPVGKGGRKGGPRPLCCACYFRERRGAKAPRLTKAGTMKELLAAAEDVVRGREGRGPAMDRLESSINDWRKAWEP